MKEPKNIVTGLIVAISIFASHLLIDIYKIGMKDGKAMKIAGQKVVLKK